MSAEQYTLGTGLYTSGLEDLSPSELVKHAESVLLFLADGTQAQRDMVSAALLKIADKRYEQALREGDVNAVLGYIRTGNFITKQIERHGFGSNFIEAKDL